jgi:FkbM family methyltransferase
MTSETLTPVKKRVIYDVGANNGDDIPYYLHKADVVVAVEANPALCELISKRFEGEIRSGRLVLENCVVVDKAAAGLVDFYIHTSDHVLSQLPQPAPSDLAMFEKVALPAKTISALIASHGDPFYVKIDIEHCDAQLLRALFSAGVFPPFISAESQSVEVFSLLVAQGGYNAFKLVAGRSVSRVYSNRSIYSDYERRRVQVSFPVHAAGPFGNDLDGAWMTADNFLEVVALEGLGWRDIHATKVETADSSVRVSDLQFVLRCARRVIKSKFGGVWASLRRSLPTR